MITEERLQDESIVPKWLANKIILELGLSIENGPHQAYFIDNNGDKHVYDTVVAGGIKQQGERYPMVYSHYKSAIAGYMDSFKEYLKSHKCLGHTKVVWREYPELKQMEILDSFETAEWYQIYSRLIVVNPEVHVVTQSTQPDV